MLTVGAPPRHAREAPQHSAGSLRCHPPRAAVAVFLPRAVLISRGTSRDHARDRSGCRRRRARGALRVGMWERVCVCASGMCVGWALYYGQTPCATLLWGPWRPPQGRAVSCGGLCGRATHIFVTDTAPVHPTSVHPQRQFRRQTANASTSARAASPAARIFHAHYGHCPAWTRLRPLRAARGVGLARSASGAGAVSVSVTVTVPVPVSCHYAQVKKYIVKYRESTRHNHSI